MKPSYITITEADVEENRALAVRGEWSCPICDDTFEAGNYVIVLRQQGRYVGPPTTIHVSCLKKAAAEAPGPRKPKSDKEFERVRANLIQGSSPLAVYLDEAPVT